MTDYVLKRDTLELLKYTASQLSKYKHGYILFEIIINTRTGCGVSQLCTLTLFGTMRSPSMYVHRDRSQQLPR
jgi:hypothetical protein